MLRVDWRKNCECLQVACHRACRLNMVSSGQNSDLCSSSATRKAEDRVMIILLANNSSSMHD